MSARAPIIEMCAFFGRKKEGSDSHSCVICCRPIRSGLSSSLRLIKAKPAQFHAHERAQDCTREHQEPFQVPEQSRTWTDLRASGAALEEHRCSEVLQGNRWRESEKKLPSLRLLFIHLHHFTRKLAQICYSHESPRPLPEDDGGTRQMSL